MHMPKPITHGTFSASGSYSPGHKASSFPQDNQLRPTHYIVRTNGPNNCVSVPLIAVDELPFTVRLQGIPRVLQDDQTHGMLHVGYAPFTIHRYQLEGDPVQQNNIHPTISQPSQHTRAQSSTSVNPIAKYLPPDAYARQALAQAAQNTAAFTTNTAISTPASNTYVPPPQRPLSAHETAKTWRSNIKPTSTTPPPTSTPANNKPADSPQTIIDKIMATESGAAEAARVGYIPRSTPTPPSGIVPDQDKKEFCTYWLRTGECDYTQQGCLYKHEMPDRATLTKIGFRDVPRWWQEKQRIIRFGGQKPTVGPAFNIKTSEWLKQNIRRGSETSESDSDGLPCPRSSGEDSDSTSSSSLTCAGNKSSGNEKVQTTKPMFVPGVTSFPSSPSSSPVGDRKASCYSDLIDLSAPLLPTPSSSASSSPKDSSTKSSPHKLITPSNTAVQEDFKPIKATADKNKTEKAPPGPNTVKVFVPKGESAEHHIAEATKKHQRRTRRGEQGEKGDRSQHARRTAPVSAIGPVKPLEQQIQEMQKAKNEKVNITSKTADKPHGLMASRHAPANTNTESGAKSSDVVAEERGRQTEKEKAGPGSGSKRSPKSSCRPRRPVGSVPVNARGEGKAKKAEKMFYVRAGGAAAAVAK
jgi:hypothetical protein